MIRRYDLYELFISCKAQPRQLLLKRAQNLDAQSMASIEVWQWVLNNLHEPPNKHRLHCVGGGVSERRTAAI